jgi:hypothetical protein
VSRSSQRSYSLTASSPSSTGAGCKPSAPYPIHQPSPSPNTHTPELREQLESTQAEMRAAVRSRDEKVSSLLEELSRAEERVRVQEDKGPLGGKRRAQGHQVRHSVDTLHAAGAVHLAVVRRAPWPFAPVKLAEPARPNVPMRPRLTSPKNPTG